MSPVAIRTFKNPAVEAFFYKDTVPKKCGWQDVSRIVARKLDMLDYASKVDDLRVPPANRLELLLGDLAGFHSIRVNDKWRIVFLWTSEGPEQVDVVDYH